MVVNFISSDTRGGTMSLQKVNPMNLSRKDRETYHEILKEEYNKAWADWKVKRTDSIPDNVMVLKSVSASEAKERIENNKCVKCGDDTSGSFLCESCKKKYQSNPKK